MKSGGFTVNSACPALRWGNKTYTQNEMLEWELPLVEIFETIEGEGLKAGFPTIFVRVFHCNLRCKWCDTPYSYAPAKPESVLSLKDIVTEVQKYRSRAVCLTGGEPLIHREKSAGLIDHLAALENIEDIHIETNGAIHLQPFAALRRERSVWRDKVRFVMDFKLPASGEMEKMILENFSELNGQDEIKFVIGSDEDFTVAADIIRRYHQKGTVLMSPVWETMPPRRLVEKVLQNGLSHVKVSLQLHKIIWDPNQRGV